MSPTSLNPAQLKTAVRIWIGAFFATLFVVVFCYKQIDVPLARALAPLIGRLEPLGSQLSGASLMTLEALVFLVLALSRVFKGKVGPLGRATAVACIASICAYAINANVLKVIFGIQGVGYVLGGAPHSLHWFDGSGEASFPSGHMALAGAFIGVFMRHYPNWTTTLATILAAIGGLLMIGGWHFLSDVLAGAFVGVTAGLLAAEIWLVVERERAEI